MTENFNFLFQYLEKENIELDKSEFLFQVQSHPDYPTLLSITDTLNFFNIDNGVLKVSSTDIELLPERFVTFLDESAQLYLVEKNNNDYLYNIQNKKSNISLSTLKSKWNEVVLLVEKSEIENTKKNKKKTLFFLLPAISFILFSAILFFFKEDIKTTIFFIFPVLGVLFSLAALKDLFGAKSELINNFCNISSSTSCSTIIGSSKWKFFEYINLSDLSIVFYTSQIASLFIYIILNNSIDFFQLQKILLFGSIPIIAISLYYQKFIEKKWCPICLVIISILILEVIYILLFVDANNHLFLNSSIIYGFVFFTSAFIWSGLKSILVKTKELKEFQIKANRFMRNYTVFKNTLISTSKIELPDSPIMLGNRESQTEITIITSPFCGHCKTAHGILEKILEANQKNLKIKIILNTEIDVESEEKRHFFRTLMGIYLEKGENIFLEAFNYWFENQDIKNWLAKYDANFNLEKIDLIYRTSNIWCVKNNFTFTPAIFINGYLYPKTHYREDLEFFINDILDDDI